MATTASPCFSPGPSHLRPDRRLECLQCPNSPPKHPKAFNVRIFKKGGETCETCETWDSLICQSQNHGHGPSQRSSQISAIARQFAVNNEGKVLIEFWWIPPITSVSTFNNYFRSKSESPMDKLCALCAPWSAGRWAPPPALEKSQTCHQHLSFGKICSCANAADPQEIKFASLPAEIPNFLH